MYAEKYSINYEIFKRLLKNLAIYSPKTTLPSNNPKERQERVIQKLRDRLNIDDPVAYLTNLIQVLSIPQMAKKLELPNYTLYKYLIVLGITKPKVDEKEYFIKKYNLSNAFGPNPFQQIKRLLSQGYTIKELAKRANTPISSFRIFLINQGIWSPKKKPDNLNRQKKRRIIRNLMRCFGIDPIDKINKLLMKGGTISDLARLSNKYSRATISRYLKELNITKK